MSEHVISGGSPTTVSCGELAERIQPSVQTLIRTQIALSLLLILWMFVENTPGILGFAAIAAGCTVPTFAWVRHRRPGIPIAPLLAVQTLLVYGLPIVLRNEALDNFTPAEIDRAGLEIGLFALAIAAGWSLAYAPKPRAARHFYGIGLTLRDGTMRLARWSLTLLGIGFAFEFGNASGLAAPVFDLLPGGSFSLIRAICSAAAIGGALLGAYCLGNGLFPRPQRVAFWAMFWGTFVLQITGFLLSGAIGIVSAVLVGLYFGRRQPPWKFAIIIFSVFAFLNISKFEMRAKYWQTDAEYAPNSLGNIPTMMWEWSATSVDILTGEIDTRRDDVEKQRLSDRINNLGILLFVQDAVTRGGYPTLNGETYTLIPQLLVPRIVWKDKPRAHEGQVTLNVHFGRQSVEETLVTYIAWGLLPEAYGNFGPFWGALICGIFLGAGFGWVEARVRPYPLASIQAFLILVLAVQTVTSFEMVASVWITTMFQALISIIIGLMPFLKLERLPEAE